MEAIGRLACYTMCAKENWVGSWSIDVDYADCMHCAVVCVTHWPLRHCSFGILKMTSGADLPTVTCVSPTHLLNTQ